MAKDQDSHQTNVIASYWTRRDAEIAQDHLDELGILASIRADDAGAMHPELQWSQGVHLVVLDTVSGPAHEALRVAKLLPSSSDEAGPGSVDPVSEATPWSGIRVLLWVFGGLVAAMALRLLLL